jgi:hypothetical protein
MTRRNSYSLALGVSLLAAFAQHTTAQPATNAPITVNGVTITLEKVASVAPLIKFHEYEKWLPCSFDYIATNSSLCGRISSVSYDSDGEKRTSVTNWVVVPAPLTPAVFLANRTNTVDRYFTNGGNLFVQSYFVKMPADSAAFSHYGQPVSAPGLQQGVTNAQWRYTGTSDEAGFRTLPKSDWRVQAPMYVAVQVPTNGEYVDLFFEMVFAFNGPQCFRTDSAFGNDFDYYMPDFADHEGDIEGVKIRVDPTFSRIIFVETFAHGTDFAFTYPPGDITFWPDVPRYPSGQILANGGTHPIIHSALHSHATYNPAYRSDRSREIFLDQIALLDQSLTRDFKVWEASTAVIGGGVALAVLGADSAGVGLLGLGVAALIIGDNTKTRVCDIVGYGGVQWRPFDDPTNQLVMVGLDTNGLPINGQAWSSFTGRIGDLMALAPQDTVPIGDDSFSNLDQDRRANLILNVTKGAYDAGLLPSKELLGNGPSGLGGRSEMPLSAAPADLIHSTVFLQSGTGTNLMLSAGFDGSITLQDFQPHDPRQQWEMISYDHWGIAYTNHGTARALGVSSGEPLLQVDPGLLDHTSLWTLGGDEGLGYHAVRPQFDDGINLNVAGNGPYGPGSPVIGYNGWGHGKVNEVWRFLDPTNTVRMILRSDIAGFPTPLVLASESSSNHTDVRPVTVALENVNDLRQQWDSKERGIGWDLRNAADGWYLFGAEAGSGFGQQLFLVPPYENTEDYRGRIYDIFAQLPGVGTNAFFDIFGTDASDVSGFLSAWTRHTSWTTTPTSYGDNNDLFNIRSAANYGGYSQAYFINFFGFYLFDTPSINVFGNYGDYRPGGPVGLWLGTPDSADNELWAMDLIINGTIFGLSGSAPPVVSCPPNLVVTNEPGLCGAAVSFGVTVSDPTLMVSTNFTYPSGTFFPVGTVTNVVTVTDTFSNTYQCSFSITVQDVEPPQIHAPASINVGNDPGLCGAKVQFVVTATDNCSATVVCVPPSGSFFPKGTNIVTCTASDPSGNRATNTFPVIVRDIEPPVIHSIVATPATLWPPDHKIISVRLKVDATDNCQLASTRIVGVTSNQPVDGHGDGHTSPDWVVTGDLTLQLRAERSGGKDRVYTITVEAADVDGNKSRKTVTVTVANSGKGK